MNNCGKSSKEKNRNKKFLRNKRSFIFLLVLCLGVGFAFLSSQLTITGNTSVSGNKWSVYFNNVQVTDGSVEATVAPTTSGTTTTSIDYTVTLDKPGDFYEFTVDAVNNGTIDAMIESINMTSLDSDVAKYLSYTATYLDGTELLQKDIIKKNSTETYKIRIEFMSDIESTDLVEEVTNLNLTFEVNYVQSTIKPVLSHFLKLVKNTAVSDSSLDFTKISSTSNGKGFYLMESTKADDYPIYYYRGAVTNNNAKFAGFCWKIVRTTDSGGTKLIYNGRPNASGGCTNTTGTSTQLSSNSVFSEGFSSVAGVGYMYGSVYGVRSHRSNGYLHGNSFTYENGSYTLKGTDSDKLDSTHHYTCLNNTGTCSSLYYEYCDWDSVYYITLNDGKSIENALSEMHSKSSNTKNSTIKTVVDNWFQNTLMEYFSNLERDYNNYLEDTVWCNDRSYLEDVVYNYNVFSESGWNPNGGIISDRFLYFSSVGRRELGTPSTVCKNKNDSFTVSDIKKGNGALTYPVGLLTSDEILLAGGHNQQNKSYYLYTNNAWWTMTPFYFGKYYYHSNSYDTLGQFHYEFVVDSNGILTANSYYESNRITSTSAGVRPSISLKPEVKVADGGDGSSATPYEFVVE